ncbi:MAG: AbrB/MazE/SpoVT family DNA-binding domain-containing protein [Betaproteobacteria bacterium]|nr:AbrB/MazE/SpoVT family DNA-binding domain-containing protein [Betaproteobacteria bacterium]
MKSSSSTVTTKGQVTIPLKIRNRLGVKPGDRIRFRELDVGVVIDREENSVETPFGALAARRGTRLAQIDEQVRKGWARRARR